MPGTHQSAAQNIDFKAISKRLICKVGEMGNDAGEIVAEFPVMLPGAEASIRIDLDCEASGYEYDDGEDGVSFALYSTVRLGISELGIFRQGYTEYLSV